MAPEGQDRSECGGYLGTKTERGGPKGGIYINKSKAVLPKKLSTDSLNCGKEMKIIGESQSKAWGQDVPKLRANWISLGWALSGGCIERRLKNVSENRVWEGWSKVTNDLNPQNTGGASPDWGQLLKNHQLGWTIGLKGRHSPS